MNQDICGRETGFSDSPLPKLQVREGCNSASPTWDTQFLQWKFKFSSYVTSANIIFLLGFKNSGKIGIKQFRHFPIFLKQIVLFLSKAPAIILFCFLNENVLQGCNP